MQKLTPVVIHVPHASTYIPKEEWNYFEPVDIEHELVVMTDHFCDDIFYFEHEMIRFPISRLVCDVERFRDDALEPMSQKGMGVTYLKAHDGKTLKTLPHEHRGYVLKTYYDSHHNKLNEAVRKRLDIMGSCLIIDGHSFYETPLPYETPLEKERADICIGTDSFHTPKCLVEMLKESFETRGYSVSINTPFAGSMVPSDYYMKDKRVSSIMIEINRKLYIDRRAQKIANYGKLKADVSAAIAEMTPALNASVVKKTGLLELKFYREIK